MVAFYVMCCKINRQDFWLLHRNESEATAVNMQSKLLIGRKASTLAILSSNRRNIQKILLEKEVRLLSNHDKDKVSTGFLTCISYFTVTFLLNFM